MNLIALSTHGKMKYTEIQFSDGDGLLFGPETRGLPESIRERTDIKVARLPMVAGNRSLNLSNSVAIVVYEAWRQLGFPA